jgi:hypothetical protein
VIEFNIATMAEVLPNCIAKRSEKIVFGPNGTKWIPLFCANCGTDGGLVMETDWDRVKNFAFYLCQPCADKWAPLANTGLAPDEVFWRKVRSAQIEAFGRELSDQEIIEALKDDESIIAKLVKDRADFTIAS